jgi:hypothetical protein
MSGLAATSRCDTRERGELLQLLLFLTALLAGFTGVFSGSRTVEPREVGQAFTAAAASIHAAPRAARRAVAQAFLQAPVLAPVADRIVAPAVPALLPELAPVDERRLE